MTNQPDIRVFMTDLLDQINSLLQDFEHRVLLDQQATHEKVAEIRDSLRDELDTRLGVAFSEIDEIKSARDDLAAAVVLVRGVQSELARLAAYLDRSTPRRVVRLSYVSIGMSILTLALLALHVYLMGGSRLLSIIGG